jgi:hypothetical protein
MTQNVLEHLPYMSSNPLERGGRAMPAVIDGPAKARLVSIDAVGKHHTRKAARSTTATIRYEMQ